MVDRALVLMYYLIALIRTEVLLCKTDREDGQNVERSSRQYDRYPSSVSSAPYGRVARAGRSDSLDDVYDDEQSTRMPSSVRRYHSDVQVETDRTHADVQSLAQNDYTSSFQPPVKGVPARRTAAMQARQRRDVDTEDIVTRRPTRTMEQSRRRPTHWLVYMGIGVVIMTLGWIVLGAVTNWWQVTQDDWHYGRPRTAQYDVAVGHNDSTANPSHFVALNLRRRIEIIECPGGDCSKAKIYVGPVLIGQGQDLAPATLSFKDVNGDGTVDMIVSVQDSRLVFINENGAFRPQRTGENIQLD
jgi:hypothetical protein